MKCETVQKKLAGYLDDALASAARPGERGAIREHLESCTGCREELQTYRKLSVLLSRVPRALPPADLAVKIKVAAAQGLANRDWHTRWQRLKDRCEILFDNVFGPLTVPATGGLFSAIIIFVFVLHMMMPGITVQADPNDIPLGLLQPAELLALADYPESAVPVLQHPDATAQHELLLDVTVDAQGQMADFDIIDGPDNPEIRHYLYQVLLFSRFRPMLSFGRPTNGGHVVLSFSSIHVRG